MSTRSAKSSTERVGDVSGDKPVLVKLGGSLLDLPDLGGRLRRVLDRVARPVLLVGGGRAADRVRQWDAALGLDNRTSHDLAIAAMTFNAERLCDAEVGYRLVMTPEEFLDVFESGDVPVLDAFAVLKHEERQVEDGSGLPASWDVTSDSIAAWLANRWRADLCLLKSVDPGDSPAQNLDLAFPHYAERLQNVDWVNLRSHPPSKFMLEILPDGMRAKKHPDCIEQPGA